MAGSGYAPVGLNVDWSAWFSESRGRASGRQSRRKRVNMNRIERLFVRAKHWQIFLLFVVVFAVGEFPVIDDFTAAVNSAQGSGGLLYLTEAATAVAAWCFLLWLWSLGSFLNSILPSATRPRKKFFLFAFIYSAVYVPTPIALFAIIAPRLFVAMIPLSLLAVFCMFYNLYFVAKNLVMAETGKSAAFFDRAGPFLLLCFAIVGVWIIQPRINRLYAEKQSTEATT